MWAFMAAAVHLPSVWRKFLHPCLW